MKPLPLASVIIPCYNAQKYIAESLDSVLAQTYKNLEIIVVDDGSSDNTKEIVQQYKSKINFYEQNHFGVSTARNKGISKSSGEYLCFFDADDIMLSHMLSTLINFMEQHSNIGLIFCDYQNFNNTGYFPKTHFQTCPILWPQIRGQKELVIKKGCSILAQENFGICGTMLIRRKMLKYENGFNPSLKSSVDFHFYFRIARHSEIGIINKVGMMRRIHESNLTSNNFQTLSQGILSRSMLKQNEQDPETRSHLSRYIAGCRNALARYHADHGQYLRSLGCALQVIFGSLHPSEFKNACRNIMRTTAMAVGLHRPKEK